MTIHRYMRMVGWAAYVSATVLIGTGIVLTFLLPGTTAGTLVLFVVMAAGTIVICVGLRLAARVPIRRLNRAHTALAAEIEGHRSEIRAASTAATLVTRDAKEAALRYGVDSEQADQALANASRLAVDAQFIGIAAATETEQAIQTHETIVMAYEAALHYLLAPWRRERAVQTALTRNQPAGAP